MIWRIHTSSTIQQSWPLGLSKTYLPLESWFTICIARSLTHACKLGICLILEPSFICRKYNAEPDGAELPAFSQWIKKAIQAYGQHDDLDNMDLLLLSFPPKLKAYSYKKMKAYGNHYRVHDDNNSLYVTYDSGIASTFHANITGQSSQSATSPFSYVGILVDILRLDYGPTSMPIVLMKGKWVRADWDSHRPSMKRDAYGFLLVDTKRTLPMTSEPFIFPSQVEQVFFSDVDSTSGWKVVLHKEARSRRVLDETPDLTLIDNGSMDDLPPAVIDPTGRGNIPVSLVGAIQLTTEEMVVARTNYMHSPANVEESDSGSEFPTSSSEC